MLSMLFFPLHTGCLSCWFTTIHLSCRIPLQNIYISYNHIINMYANVLVHSKMDYKSIHVCIWHELENHVLHTMWLCGCFLKWWYPQNTQKMIIFTRKTKPMVVGETHHFRKPPCTFYITFTPVSAACLWVSDARGFLFAKPRIHQVGPSLYRDQGQN